MKTYLIRINSATFEDVEVEAKNENDAIEEALRKTTLEDPEFCEVLEGK